MIPQFVYGCIAPVFTAFDRNGRLDPDGQRAILDFLLETKSVSSFFVRSGMGQMYTFSKEDTRLIADIACKHMAGKGAVLVGAAGIWNRDYAHRPDPAVFVKEAVELSRYAEQAGAGGVVHTVPEAIEPGPVETCADVFLRYFETVQNAVKIPVFIYQPPGTESRYCITPELITRVAAMPNVKGIKVSSHDAEYIFDLTYAVNGKDFAYICGCETAFLAALLTGARAVIGQGASVSPQILKQVQLRYEAGDLPGAMDAQHATNMLVYRSRNTVEFFKRYINEKGYKVGTYSRDAGNPYATAGPVLTDHEYEEYKQLLESELARFS